MSSAGSAAAVGSSLGRNVLSGQGTNGVLFGETIFFYSRERRALAPLQEAVKVPIHVTIIVYNPQNLK